MTMCRRWSCGQLVVSVTAGVSLTLALRMMRTFGFSEGRVTATCVRTGAGLWRGVAG